MSARDFMRQLWKLDKMIENKIAEREQWMARATSTTGASAPETGVRVQSSGSQQKMADAIDTYIDIGREITASIERLNAEKQRIISVIEQLDMVEYDILYKRYVGIVRKGRIHYMEYNEIADLYGKSYSWATTMHGIALKKVQKIIDETKI